jgi:hypothetical protein
MYHRLYHIIILNIMKLYYLKILGVDVGRSERRSQLPVALGC